MATAWRLEFGSKLSPYTGLEARHFGFSPYATGAPPDAALVLGLGGSESVSPKSVVGPLRGDS